ncbi:MAG: hypothetical protein KAG34_03320 [Cocleimonas sp.]|nr:hypothetical protein [Cocleimonas sp.]
MKIFLFFTMLSLLSACNSTGGSPPAGPEKPISPYQQTLNKYKQRWQQANIKNYRYTFQRSCFCMRDFTKEVITTVNNNKVVNAHWKDSKQALDHKFKNNKQNIDYFFIKIQDAIDRKAALITVKYNETYGYPEKISIDYDKMIADEELSLSAKNFRKLK